MMMKGWTLIKMARKGKGLIFFLSLLFCFVLFLVSSWETSYQGGLRGLQESEMLGGVPLWIYLFIYWSFQRGNTQAQRHGRSWLSGPLSAGPASPPVSAQLALEGERPCWGQFTGSSCHSAPASTHHTIQGCKSTQTPRALPLLSVPRAFVQRSDLSV